jgi:hypothetical protein
MKKFKIDYLDSDKCIIYSKETKWETLNDCQYYAHVVMWNAVPLIASFNIIEIKNINQ